MIALQLHPGKIRHPNHANIIIKYLYIANVRPKTTQKMNDSLSWVLGLRFTVFAHSNTGELILEDKHGDIYVFKRSLFSIYEIPMIETDEIN